LLWEDWIHQGDEVSACFQEGCHLVSPAGSEFGRDGDKESNQDGIKGVVSCRFGRVRVIINEVNLFVHLELKKVVHFESYLP
jgi:hypothetical protein